MSSRAFVLFDINQESNTPVSEIDPDLQFTLKVTIYTIRNVATIWKTLSMIVSLNVKQRISMNIFLFEYQKFAKAF